MKLGIALGGGGAKGLAHIGVLQELVRAGISFDVVAGCSAGALVGACYVSGTLDELEKRALQLKWWRMPLLLSPSFSLRGFFTGKAALDFFDDLIASDRIEALPKPYAAVATNYSKGMIHTMASGDLKFAMRSSIGIPIIFTPMKTNEDILFDGGILEPVPVEAARGLGADFVVGVDLFGGTGASAWLPGEKRAKGLPSLVDSIERTIAVNQTALTSSRLKQFPAEYVIRPEISVVRTLEFHRGKDAIEIGRRAGRAAVPALQSLLQQAGRT